MTPEQLVKARGTLLFALIGMILSKGMAILPAYTGDDYATIFGTVSNEHFLAQGRYVNAGLTLLLDSMGLTPSHVAFPSFVLLAVAAAAVVTLMLIYVAPSKVPQIGLGIAALLATTHPYFTEYFLFRQSMFFQLISLSLVAITLWGLISFENVQAPPSLWRYFAFAAPLVLACALLQTSFVIVAIAVFGRIVVNMMPGSGMTLRAIARTSSAPVFLLIFAGALYTATFLISTGMAPRLDTRTSLLGASQIAERLDQGLALATTVLYRNEPILSTFAKFPFFLALAIGMIGTGVAQRDLRGPLLFALAFAVVHGLSMTFVLISAEWWPAPRSLYAISMAAGILFVLAYANAHRAFQTAMIFLGAVAALSFSFHSAAMLRDQLRLNNWDRWAAGAIASSLLAEGVTPEQNVMLVGASWTHPVTLPTTYFDINVSSLFLPWGLNALMMETTGHRWRMQPVAEHPGCQNAPRWPAPGSIVIQDSPGPVLVCYGK
jgi:hypothetical protein